MLFILFVILLHHFSILQQCVHFLFPLYNISTQLNKGLKQLLTSWGCLLYVCPGVTWWKCTYYGCLMQQENSQLFAEGKTKLQTQSSSHPHLSRTLHTNYSLKFFTKRKPVKYQDTRNNCHGNLQREHATWHQLLSEKCNVPI